ncbi:hypothetical protein [Staphylococcus hyicus]|uniref:hypothetical protein n=1 Tax=Staphylococcus hyicus TaxID=1284 RepID=UPI0031331D10
MSKEITVRVKIDEDLNQKIKELALDKNISRDKLISEALMHFIDFEKGLIKNDNIYTSRINELTYQIELMRTEQSLLNSTLLNRLDSIIEYQNPKNYLH